MAEKQKEIMEMTERITIEDALDTKKFLEFKSKQFQRKMKALKENIKNGTAIAQEEGGWFFRESLEEVKPPSTLKNG